MFEASLGILSLPIDSSQTFSWNSSEFMGKLIKDCTISRPKSRPQILDVDSLALYDYRRTISDRTFTNLLIYTNANNCQVLVKCSWLKISEDSLGRDKTLHQTSHEHFSSVNKNDFIAAKWWYMQLFWSNSFLIPRVLSLPNRHHVTALGSCIQINKERNIAAPDKVLGNPTQKWLPVCLIIIHVHVCIEYLSFQRN